MKKILSRRGATLTELVVVMALMAIASLIIVSFSSMAYSFSDRNEEEYLFLEECATAEAALRAAVAEWDVAGNEYVWLNYTNPNAPKPKKLALRHEGNEYRILDDAFSSEKIVDISFAVYEDTDLTNANALIRCTLKGEGAREQSFLLVLRCAENGGAVNV